MARVKSKKYDGVYLNHLKNGDISYSVLYKDINNKTQRITVGKKSQGITEQYCNQKRIETLNKVLLGEQPTSIQKRSKKSSITLDEVANKYLNYLQTTKSHSSYKEIKSKYTNHLSHLKNQGICSITKEQLIQIQQSMLKRKYAPKTINQVVELFGTIFNYGFKEELYSNPNPTMRVTHLSVNNTRERFLNNEEIDLLFERIKDNELIYLFTKLALTTGARIQSILAIQKKDIDLASEFIHINDFKSNTGYKAFITKELYLLLSKKIQNIYPNDYVVSLDGTKTTARQIQCRLKPILDELFNQGLEAQDNKNRVVIHTLRHTFASHLATNGTPIYTVQKLMNHKDIKMTQRYAKLSPDSGKEFIENLYN
ncbi:site-specific integrase [Sulfurovum sp.]|jgi:integrase|uniref:tyrosine-type recombinase/integrase n=1 Tax=Sulfurovum sp. TaxID=1969726 RepID=UPI002A3716C7|nr:site-specific integrase [Sulfurovum sp.]MDY0403014.1 site-specific integrase [Sulfurovum sp.]